MLNVPSLTLNFYSTYEAKHDMTTIDVIFWQISTFLEDSVANFMGLEAFNQQILP